MQNNFVMLVGIPACGKSTRCKQFKEDGYRIHSSDQLRIELYGDLKGDNAIANVFEELHIRIITDLKKGYNVVYDATNLSSKRRIHFLKQISNIDCYKVAVVVATPYNECIDRDKNRDKKVGSEVIKRMYENFQMPCVQEGFDYIDVFYNTDVCKIPKYSTTLEKMISIYQNNSHHTKTIGNHCLTTYGNLLDKNVDNETINTLQYAGLLHDCGKPFVMSFKDSNNKLSEECHYYKHENVGAYDSLFHLYSHSLDFKLETILLVNYHMLPHQLKSEKLISKWKNFFGDTFWGKLMLLHEADKEAQ